MKAVVSPFSSSGIRMHVLDCIRSFQDPARFGLCRKHGRRLQQVQPPMPGSDTSHPCRAWPERTEASPAASKALFRQRDEIALVTHDFRKTPGLPVLPGLLDTVLARLVDAFL